ncbi:MAG: STAS domain-containing protein [Alphaproteobacteria bacterium]|nr:STAS domain-containing protein [Alphaproteobacteria bacterium]MBO7097253.1 STAS domain-containing protein [Alphaproteobacteria bacterium]
MENEAKTLKIEQTRENDVLTCRLFGWLDPNTSPDFLNSLDLTNVKQLICDMEHVEYVFSAGLRAFLQLQKNLEETGGKILLVNVSDSIRSVFEYTGFSNILEPKA